MADIEQVCEKWALDNALKYGKAQGGSVMGKIMQVHKELRKEAKAIKEFVAEKVNFVNKLSETELLDLAHRRYPELLNQE